ncbi:COG1470 family protein [Candidatus Nanohalobium constans]|uniref:Ig-like domain-containing protein n=1 Tax=Candidatus Nanohalobium constans TaxID=2565781 RepID=A0A5Q0UH39_9ARCH|nr:hypothetical protein [Candidatus Nanohalobium constans]QGA80681.1 hypothetical protein LC1Nh_0797 [Candidatus Nanohalobium constans]
MITIRSPLKKTLLLLTLTTLTISLGTALQWDQPDENAHINDEFELTVTGNDGLDDVELYYDEGDGWESADSMSESSTKGTYTKTGVDSDIGSYEGLELKANTSGEDSTDDRTVTLDVGEPQVEYNGDGEFVQKDPTVTFEVSDEYSEVTGAEISVDSNDGDVSVDGDDEKDPNCDVDDTCDVEFDIDTEDLEEGDEIEVTVTADDEAGNIEKQDETFTLDSEWDGDSSASVEWVESESSVLTGFEDEDQDLDISFQPDTVSDTTVICEVDGDEVDNANIDASDEDETASCEFDSDDYAGSSFELTVEAEDEAGNSETLVDEKRMVWDTDAPSVDRLEQPQGVSTFNSGFDLSVLVNDDASGIESLEYYFDAGTELGEGSQVDLEDSESTVIDHDFKVEPGDLSRGSHTVYVRAEDGTGLTDVSSFDFEYYPNRNPEINLGAPDRFEVTSGESKTFDLSIENGAPFFLNSVEVTSSSAAWDGTRTVTGLEEGDSVKRSITVDASSLDVGVYDLKIQTANYDASKTVEVVVRATEDQKQSIESSLQDWKSKRDVLNENISKIGNLEASDEDISQFTETVSKAEKAAEKGNYYEVKSHLSSIDSSFEQASQTFSEKKDTFQKKQRNQMYLIGFFLLVLIGGGGVAAYLYSGEEDVSELIPEDWDVELPEEMPEIGVREKVEELVGEAEEEVEEETGYSFK